MYVIIEIIRQGIWWLLKEFLSTTWWAVTRRVNVHIGVWLILFDREKHAWVIDRSHYGILWGVRLLFKILSQSSLVLFSVNLVQRVKEESLRPWTHLQDPIIGVLALLFLKEIIIWLTRRWPWTRSSAALVWFTTVLLNEVKFLDEHSLFINWILDPHDLMICLENVVVVQIMMLVMLRCPALLPLLYYVVQALHYQLPDLWVPQVYHLDRIW